MMNIRICFVTSLLLLASTLLSAQIISVTVDDQKEVSMSSLDFKTTLDQTAIDQMEKKGITVDVLATRLSAQGTSYECILKSVSKTDYDSLGDAWKIKLASAQTSNVQQTGQDKFLSQLYADILSDAKSKALPMAMAMRQTLGDVSEIELLEYKVMNSSSAVDPLY